MTLILIIMDGNLNVSFDKTIPLKIIINKKKVPIQTHGVFQMIYYNGRLFKYLGRFRSTNHIDGISCDPTNPPLSTCRPTDL